MTNSFAFEIINIIITLLKERVMLASNCRTSYSAVAVILSHTDTDTDTLLKFKQ